MKANIDFSGLKTYTVPVLSFLAVILLIPFVILPQLDQISKNSQVIRNNKDRLDALNVKVNALQSASEKEEQIGEYLETTEEILPISKAIAPLVLGVQQLAINNNLTVKKISLQPGKVATDSASAATPQQPVTPNTPAGQTVIAGDSEVVFDLNVEGNITSLQSFLKVLERGKRLLILKKFKADFNSSDGNYIVQIFFAAPYSPLPQIGSDQLASPLPEISQQDEELLQKLASSVFTNITTSKIAPGPTGVDNPF